MDFIECMLSSSGTFLLYMYVFLVESILNEIDVYNSKTNGDNYMLFKPEMYQHKLTKSDNCFSTCLLSFISFLPSFELKILMR